MRVSLKDGVQIGVVDNLQIAVLEETNGERRNLDKIIFFFKKRRDLNLQLIGGERQKQSNALYKSLHRERAAKRT